MCSSDIQEDQLLPYYRLDKHIIWEKKSEVISQGIFSFYPLMSLAYIDYFYGRTEALRAEGAKTKLKCIICHREFKSLPALNGHMRSHGGFRTHPSTLKTVSLFTLNHYKNVESFSPATITEMVCLQFFTVP